MKVGEKACQKYQIPDTKGLEMKKSLEENENVVMTEESNLDIIQEDQSFRAY
jgi:hypothetical protein